MGGYKGVNVPTIVLKGKWLEELEFGINVPILVKCEEKKLVIVREGKNVYNMYIYIPDARNSNDSNDCYYNLCYFLSIRQFQTNVKDGKIAVATAPVIIFSVVGTYLIAYFFKTQMLLNRSDQLMRGLDLSMKGFQESI